MNTTLSYVSLFSSAGLGCYGFKQAGFDCVATAELLPRRLEVQKANNVASHEAAYILGDLSKHQVRDELFTEVAKWNSRTHNDLTAVIATPPCQGMSVANHKKQDELTRNSLVVHSLNIIEALKPRFFLLENVRAFLTSACLDDDGETRSIGEAIDRHLAGSYAIKSQVVNLKDFGAPSSRTRTLVIGVRRDLHDITPSSIWPESIQSPVLKDLIYDLPRMTTMGQISSTDIYHGFRSYDERMRTWIHDLEPGESAFDNTSPEKRPHRIIGGKRVENKSSNGDKYRRTLWSKVAPCVHTRNDILASQSTIHPEDDRVFSIRELSRMMGVPDKFRWANFSLGELNELPYQSKIEFLRTHEINIRQCLGEGVPTPVFYSIAKNMASCRPSISRAGRPPKNEGTPIAPNATAAAYLQQAQPTPAQAKEYAAYYTRQDTAFNLLSHIEPPKSKKPLRVLEPSVGAGAFLPELFKKFDRNPITLDLVDIDQEALNQARQLATSVGIPSNFTINYINKNFLTNFTESGYDYIVGNPPFGLSGQHNPKLASSFNIGEIYGKFIEKSINIGRTVSFVIPKSFLGSREMKSIRDYLSANKSIVAIDDYGEDAFHNINIETIGLTVSGDRRIGRTRVTSIPLKQRSYPEQSYIASAEYPSWLIYRNRFFDQMADQLHLGSFKAYRDRKITKADTGPNGNVPVVRARNIKNGKIDTATPPIEYTDRSMIPANFKVLVTDTAAIVVPNLSYYPRASYLPADAYVDGSAAVLVPARELPGGPRVEFYSSQDFFFFYRIARNYSTRSLNVDAISSHYWGVPRSNYLPLLNYPNFQASSKLLFKVPIWNGLNHQWEVSA